MKNSTGFRTPRSKALFVLALISGMVVSIAGTAQADNDWRGHERDAHQWHKQHIHHRHYVPESYAQEDPYVVYAPPVVVEPPSGINIIVPLHIR